MRDAPRRPRTARRWGGEQLFDRPRAMHALARAPPPPPARHRVTIAVCARVVTHCAARTAVCPSGRPRPKGHGGEDRTAGRSPLRGPYYPNTLRAAPRRDTERIRDATVIPLPSPPPLDNRRRFNSPISRPSVSVLESTTPLGTFRTFDVQKYTGDIEPT